MLKNGFLALLATVAICGVTPAMAESHNHHDHGASESAQALKATTHKITEHIYMINGKGGNVGLFVGEDGAFLIDNEYAEATPAILSAVKAITQDKVRFVINTHWHGDHTGGNEILGKEGGLIVAHDNVRSRLSVDNYIPAFDMKSEAAPKIALPLITYNDQTTFHINGDTVRVIHVENAHTDGDSFVHFEHANVIHTGDVFFNGFYPFIDASTGGSLNGVIQACDKILALADDKTVIMPGHGPISHKAELQAYHDMLVGVRDAIKPMIDAGKTFDEIKAADPLAPFNAEWADGFLSPDVWLKIVYDAMVS
ncbi:MAG: MBL fold metallo-hydrolase [Alphaproteobacteria bacterium]